MSFDDDDNNVNKGPWGNPPQGGKKKGEDPQNPEIEQMIRKGQERIYDIFNKANSANGGGGGGSGSDGEFPSPFANKSLFLIVAAILIGIYIVMRSFYIVDAKEEGVVLRFGKYDRTTTPGFNVKFPEPIEKVIKLRVTDRYRTEIGDRVERTSRLSRSRVTSRSNNDLLMLTGDENLVDVGFEVQWQIDDSRKFLFNVYDPQLTVRNSAESAMREMIGTTPLNDILSEGRTKLQDQTKVLLQAILDSYDVGILIEEINMRAVPPSDTIKVDNIITGEDGEFRTETITTTVDEAFKDVQAAIINKEEIINMAIARSNEVIPEARGQAQKLIQEAQGYKEQVIAKAQGEASRFNAVYKEYKRAKNVTRKRIYLETMEEIMDGMDKIIIDGKNSNLLPYLPLKELGKK